MDSWLKKSHDNGNKGTASDVEAAINTNKCKQDVVCKCVFALCELDTKQRRRLEWWYPGRDFVVALFIGQNIGEDQKKGLRCKTSWFSVRKYVMTKKKGLYLPITGFLGLKRKKKTKWCHPKMVIPEASRPPSDATDTKDLLLLFPLNNYHQYTI